MSSVVPPTLTPAAPSASLSGDGFVEPSLLPAPLVLDLSARALEALSARVSRLPVQDVCCHDFGQVKASALSVLAEQFHVLGDEGWELCETDAQRRALLKGAIALHRHKGTKWSVVRALEILGLAAAIEEWFEYGGEPFCFRIVLDATQLGVPDLGAVIRAAQEWKNARSHLEVLRVRLRGVPAVRIRAAAQFAHTIRIGPGIHTDAQPAPCGLDAHVGLIAAVVVSVYPVHTFDAATAARQASVRVSVAAHVVEQVSTGVGQ